MGKGSYKQREKACAKALRWEEAWCPEDSRDD